MKILYLTKGDHIDYLDDCLLIGLRELLGSDVVDYNKREHNYVTYDINDSKRLYGKGMTVSCILDDIKVDRSDITKKIKNKYFDRIVYSSIWRFNDYIDKILELYPKNKVIAIDGEDEHNIHKTFNLGIPYFKRELVNQNDRLFPIHFAIPTCKINFNKEKIKNYSYITPFDYKTYIYDNENDYYQDYQGARFGVTTRKSGWDCMRHYEIMTNGCIPHFANIDYCPETILTKFPKILCKHVNHDLLKDTPKNVYDKYAEQFKEHLVNNNTTLALAKYFIETISKI